MRIFQWMKKNYALKIWNKWNIDKFEFQYFKSSYPISDVSSFKLHPSCLKWRNAIELLTFNLSVVVIFEVVFTIYLPVYARLGVCI